MQMRTLYIALASLLLSANSWADDYYYSDPSYRETEQEFYNSPQEISGYDVSTPRTKKIIRHHHVHTYATRDYSEFASRLPKTISTYGKKIIYVDPNVHAWGAYSSDGKLIRSGLATAGANWCSDIDRPCRTKSGIYHINSLGDSDCVSNEFPVDEGGAPMPYCMYFNGGQALHGSHELAEDNISHGCVRISVSDARWLRFNFAEYGTTVIIKSY